MTLLRYPGTTLANLGQPIEPLVAWIAEQLDIPARAFARYARRSQTVTDHARQLAAALGVRPATAADLPLMAEAAAAAARGTDAGAAIAAGVAAALRRARIILPAVAVIERTAVAGRARARQRAEETPSPVSPAQAAEIERLLVTDPSLGTTPFAWLNAMPLAPKADHVRGVLERLQRARPIGLPAEAAEGVHEARLRQFVREADASDAHRLARYALRRRRAILVATVLDLEARLVSSLRAGTVLPSAMLK